MSIQYRPEIDGLRAVAVLAVLLCHANFTLFSGGFVGVDIFFVISGFLITSLIVRDLEQRSFSFAGFWEQRIRRILPPLMVVVLTSVIAGWFLYLPGDYDLLGQQVAAQAVFASNILFKAQAGYFDTENIVKPLLHTWSLAVEEQFYLLFPIAIFLTWKYRQQKTFKYFAIFTALSFVAAGFIVRNSPSSAFYLLPFRAWELMVGVLMVLNPQSCAGLKKEIMGWAGLVAILAGVFFYNEHMLFPGVTAVLPCFGAAAIIGSNTGGLNRVGKLLSMRGPVFVGLVSYSLYLWHWPILAFVRYSGEFEFTGLIAALCLGAAFILAVLSWKFIETPFRQKKIFPTRKGIYIAAALSLASMAIVGLGIHFAKGVSQRLPEDVVKFAAGAQDRNPFRDSCNKPKFDRFENGGICQSNAGKHIEPSFVMWGDSFADAIAPAFYELSSEYEKNGYVITADGCPPILDYKQDADLAFDCPGFNERVLKMIEEKKIKHVVLVGNWTDRLRNPVFLFRDNKWYEEYKDDYDDLPMAGLKRTADRLQALGVRVYIFIDVPYAAFNPPRLLAMNALYGLQDKTHFIRLQDYRERRKATIDQFREKNTKSEIVFIDPADRLCGEEKCHISDKGNSLYYDDGHLSKYGALYVKDMFAEYFRKDF